MPLAGLRCPRATPETAREREHLAGPVAESILEAKPDTRWTPSESAWGCMDRARVLAETVTGGPDELEAYLDWLELRTSYQLIGTVRLEALFATARKLEERGRLSAQEVKALAGMEKKRTPTPAVVGS